MERPTEAEIEQALARCEGFDHPAPGEKEQCDAPATWQHVTSGKYFCSAHVASRGAIKLPPVIDTDLF